MAKGNSTSIRYSDEVAEIIERQEGNTFAEKFHNLVFLCNNMVPDLKREITILDNEIKIRKHRMADMAVSIQRLITIEHDIKNVRNLINKIDSQLNKM